MRENAQRISKSLCKFSVQSCILLSYWTSSFFKFNRLLGFYKICCATRIQYGINVVSICMIMYCVEICSSNCYNNCIRSESWIKMVNIIQHIFLDYMKSYTNPFDFSSMLYFLSFCQEEMIYQMSGTKVGMLVQKIIVRVTTLNIQH